MGVVDHVKRALLLLKVWLEHLTAVIGHGSVRSLYWKLVSKKVLGAFRVIALILEYGITDSLDFRILCWINLKTATVEKCVGLSLVVACCNKISDYVVGKSIYKVGVDGWISAGLLVDVLDPWIYIICKSSVILDLGDELVLEHVVKDLGTTLGVLFGMGDGVKPTRILSDGSNYCALWKGKVWNRLVEISKWCSLYTQCILAKVDGVHVVEKDILLGHSLLKLNGQVLFLNLTFYTLQKCFVCPSGEYAVL